MNNLSVLGKQDFMGKEIPVIEGGFGEGQKVVLAKTIAEIHGVDLKRVNELIGNNLDEFEEGVDILNLMDDNFKVVATDLGFITSNGQKYCYLLSEQGYMLLVGFMRTEKAKELRKQFRREYFAMREVINSDEQLKANLLLNIYKGGQDGILAARRLTDIEVRLAIKPLEDKIDQDKPLVEFAETISSCADSIDVGTFAKLVKDEGINMGRNKLFNWLRDNGYLMKNNIPYQKYIDNKYFEVVEYVFNTPYGEKIRVKTLVTGIGQVRLVEKLRKESLYI